MALGDPIKSVQEVLNRVWDPILDVLKTNTSVTATIAPGDIQIGAVEIKNATTDDRATVNVGGQIFVKASDLEAILTAIKDVDGIKQIQDPVEIRLYDAAGNALTSTTVGPKQAADVFIAGGESDVNLRDGSGSPISSTGGALDVNVNGGSITADFAGDEADLDSGAGVDSHEVFAIGLPGAGGHVVGGTATDPLRVDPTGTTTQPISAASLPLPTGAATEVTLAAINTKLVSGTDIGDVTINNAAGAAAVNVQDGGNSITVDGIVDVNLQDGVGNDIGSTAGALNVNISSGSLAVTLPGDQADLDTAAGVDNHAVVSIGLPGSGGHVVGGTATDPLRVDPTGTTVQPISINQTGANNDVDASLRDGSGTPITSTGGALDVNIASGITLEVNLDNANDDVLAYGWDGSANQKIKTDAAGELQVDVLNFPAVQSVDDNGGSLTVDGSVSVSNFPAVQPVSDNAGSLTVDGTVDVNLQDGAGSDISSTGGSLHVTVTSGSIDASLPGDDADLDSGAGTDDHAVVAIGLPGAGGHVVGGTSTNPLRTDTTGTTTQPISAVSLPLPTGASTEATLSAINAKLVSGTDIGDVTVNNAAGAGAVNIQDGGNSLTVDGVVDVNLQDGAGNDITSTAGALDVNIASGITLEVNLDNANDDVLVYGWDGAANQKIKTDVGGELQVDVLNFPAVQPVSDNGGSLTVDGSVSVSNFPAVQPVDDNGGSLTVDDGGITLSVDDGGGSLTVDGTVTVGNAAGASAVNIQDGGNSITVDGTINANLQDGAGTDITSTTAGAKQALDVNIASFSGSDATFTVEHNVNLAQGTTFASFGFSGTARRFTIVNFGTKNGYLSLDGGTSQFWLPIGASYEPPVSVSLVDTDIQVKSETSTTDFQIIVYK